MRLIEHRLGQHRRCQGKDCLANLFPSLDQHVYKEWTTVPQDGIKGGTRIGSINSIHQKKTAIRLIYSLTDFALLVCRLCLQAVIAEA